MGDGQGQALTDRSSGIMRIHITRRGGIAGIELTADVDTDSFAKETAARIEQELQQLVARGGERTVPPHPDAFEYEIVVPERGQSVRVGESELPPELRPIVAELATHGKLGRSRSRGSS